MSEETDRFQTMENERNQRMMVLMTGMKDYIGTVTKEINELRNLLGVTPTVVTPPAAEEKPKPKPKAKAKAKAKKKSVKEPELPADQTQ